MTTIAEAGTPTPVPTRVPWWTGALAGVVAAAVALGAAEGLAGAVGPIPSLVQAIGDAVVDLGAGTPVNDLSVEVFGTGQRTALLVGTVVLALALGAGVGLLARRAGAAAGAAGVALFGVLGVLATLANPLASTAWAVPAAVVAVLAGAGVLRWLLGYAGRVHVAAAAGDVRADRGRRDLLRISAALVAVSGVTGLLGRTLRGRAETSAARAAVVLPPADGGADVPPATAFEDVDGISPLFTPTDDFYRIDTALMPPVVDVASWSVRIHGMVDREVVLTYDDLLAMDQIEQDITIACVSNEVGGDLIGTARWQGVLLADVLDLAGVDPAATQLVGRSVDGWTGGFPTPLALDDRMAMVAVAMNGEPLPVEHGFPARLIVPGLYGYVSATKWLAELELTTWEAFDAYWVPRGWAKEGPVKTQSRIDVPGGSVPAGPTWIAGVAWAQRRGITAVEVQVDDGPWEQAELAAELDVDTWRQWRLRWDAAAGDHTIRVRATDGEGRTQREERVPVAPDGAEGWHTRRVRVV